MFITPNHTGDYCFISKELKVPNFHVAQYRAAIFICGPDKFHFLILLFPILLIILPCVAPMETNGSERKASCIIKKGERHKDCVYEK